MLWFNVYATELEATVVDGGPTYVVTYVEYLARSLASVAFIILYLVTSLIFCRYYHQSLFHTYMIITDSLKF